MPKHPTLEIPNIGAMDHAWDLIGHWVVDVELPDESEAIKGHLDVRSWTEAELHLEPWTAAEAGLPADIELERASRVHLTDAGGGALQWVLLAPEAQWMVQVTLWPGSIHLFIHDVEQEERQLYRAHGSRTRDYYLAKYPLVTT